MWSRRDKPGAASLEVLVFDVEGMHCGSCGLSIDDAVEDIVGVTRSTTSFKARMIETVLAQGADRGHVAEEVLRAVAAAGYRASLRTG